MSVVLHTTMPCLKWLEADSRMRVILIVLQQPNRSSRVRECVLVPHCAMSSADHVTPPSKIRRGVPSPPSAGDLITPPRVNKRKRTSAYQPDMEVPEWKLVTPPRPTSRGLPKTPDDRSQSHSSATKQNQKPAAGETSHGKVIVIADS